MSIEGEELYTQSSFNNHTYGKVTRREERGKEKACENREREARSEAGKKEKQRIATCSGYAL